MNVSPKKTIKKHGIRHVLAALSYSWCGAQRLWKETAFRHEILAIGLIFLLFYMIGASSFFFVASFFLFLITIAVEALNTAIEEVVDLVSPQWSLKAKYAKDLGSFAVFLLLLCHGIFTLFVVLTTLDWI